MLFFLIVRIETNVTVRRSEQCAVKRCPGRRRKKQCNCPSPYWVGAKIKIAISQSVQHLEEAIAVSISESELSEYSTTIEVHFSQ